MDSIKITMQYSFIIRTLYIFTIVRQGCFGVAPIPMGILWIVKTKFKSVINEKVLYFQAIS